MEFKKLTLAVAISSALLTACGGGGGGGSGSTSSTPATYSVSGTAAKGIIQHGIVTAKEYVGTNWNTVGTSTTDENGDYSLLLSGYAGGILKIEITAGANTTMKCDGSSGCGNAAFGQSVALPQNFTMAAVLPAVSTATLTSIPVTPYTNMAAAIAETNLASSTDKKAAVTDALAKVTNLVGFDVANTPAIDITAQNISSESAAAQRAATMSAALMSFTSDSKSIADVIQELADSIKDGKLDSNDNITPAALEQSWVDIADSDTYKTLLPSTTIDSVKQQASVIEQNISDDGSLSVAANPLYSATDIAKAKALITNTRSLVYNIANTDFDSPLNAIDASAAQAAEVFDKDSAAMASLLGLAVDEMFAQLINNQQVHLGGSYPVEIKSGSDTLGTLTLTTTNTSAGLSAVLSGSLKGTEPNARTITVNNLTLSTDLSFDEINYAKTDKTQYTVNISGSISDGLTSMSVNNGQAQATFASALTDTTGDNLGNALTVIELKNLDLSLQANGSTFTGNAKFKLVKPDVTKISKALYDSFPLTLKSVALSGDFTTIDSQDIKASVGLDLANSETFDLRAFLNNENTVWVHKDSIADNTKLAQLKTAISLYPNPDDWHLNYGYSKYNAWNNSNYSADYSMYNANTLSWSGNTFNTQEAYQQYATILDPVSEMQKVIASDYATIPNSEVQSAYIQIGGWGLKTASPQTYNNLYGEIKLGSYEESSSNFLKVNANATFELTNVTGLPHAKVSAIVDRNSFTGGSASLAFTWGNNYYTINLDNVDVEKQTGSITVTDPLGTKLTLTDVSIQDKTGSGSLYVGTNKVATVKTLDNGAVKITYTDGTFETLQ